MSKDTHKNEKWVNVSNNTTSDKMFEKESFKSAGLDTFGRTVHFFE